MTTRPTRRKAAPAAAEPDIERDISPVRAPEDIGEASLRPQTLALFVALGLDPRAYPFGRPTAVEAPQRVGPRIACAGDGCETGITR